MEHFDFEDKVDGYLAERLKLKTRNDAGICRHFKMDEKKNTCDKGDDCRYLYVIYHYLSNELFSIYAVLHIQFGPALCLFLLLLLIHQQ